MEYWLQWNQLAGSQAHFRIQLETVSRSDVGRTLKRLFQIDLGQTTIVGTYRSVVDVLDAY